MLPVDPVLPVVPVLLMVPVPAADTVLPVMPGTQRPSVSSGHRFTIGPSDPSGSSLLLSHQSDFSSEATTPPGTLLLGWLGRPVDSAY